MSMQRGYDDEAVGSVARNKKRSTALSCAECRRLKLRCDRKFPCSACIKRGCSQICPEGSLTTGKGNRFVLANTEVLHEKIAELCHRVRALEDALAVAHSAIHNDRHPLLSDELLRIKNPLEREVVAQPPKVQDEEDAIDAVGSLSISPSGKANFFGTTANAWYLLKNEESDLSEDEEPLAIALPVDVPWLSHAFPFSPSLGQAAADDLRSTLLAALPDAPTARELADIYFANASWFYHPVAKEQFDNHIFARVYPYATADSPVDAETDRDSGSFESHRLALLYIVLAVGILVDLNRPSHDPAAVRYFQLSKAALSLDTILEDPSVPGIQALIIMCHYMFLNDVDSQRWTLMGTVIKLAQSIGLHRDSTRWKLSPEETKLRRELFWEIYTYDSWQSLTYGRPPSLAMAHIDCKMAHETSKNGAGQIEMTFHAWKHRFSSECLSIVHDQVFGARTPSYATVTELDKRVRNYYIPPSLQVPGFGSAPYTIGSEPPSMALTMQRHVILAIKEVSLLYMHRGFFAKAMSDNPVDPLSGRYGHSVLRAHESASFFVKLVKSLWMQYRQLAERNWFLFTHVFSCAIVLGTIPTKCPGMALARSALRDLDQAYDLFSQVGERARVDKVLPVLKKLRDRAHAAMDEYENQNRNAMGGTKRESSQELLPKHEDELAALAGQTRLVPKKPQSPSSRGSRSPASSPAAAYNSPPPQTPASPTSPVGPSQLQTSFYGSQSQIQQQQQQQQYISPIEPSPVSSYSQSPEFTLFGPGNLPPEHLHGHPQSHVQMQAQLHAQAQAHWQNDPVLTVGYSSMGMTHGMGYGNGTQVSQGLGMDNMLSSNYTQGMADPGQYGMGGYYDAGSVQNMYAPQVYGQEMVSPQDVDISNDWSNLVAQYTNGL